MSYNKNLLCNRTTFTATLHFEAVSQEMPDFLNLIFEIDKGEAKSKSGCFSQEILEHEVLVGKEVGLRTVMV